MDCNKGSFNTPMQSYGTLNISNGITRKTPYQIDLFILETISYFF